jgi:quercetin dioxygenase-like cupin family protein
MRIITRSEALDGQPMDPSHFTGPATGHPLHRTDESHPVSVSLVRFEAGARNHWHHHEGGQLLHVVEGEGWVQSRGEQAQRIHAGDSVSAAPGEQHWHGAGAGHGMAHIAVSMGQTRFLEPSEAPPP